MRNIIVNCIAVLTTAKNDYDQLNMLVLWPSFGELSMAQKAILAN